MYKEIQEMKVLDISFIGTQVVGERKHWYMPTIKKDIKEQRD